jgi:glycosyltransferase involved in cell wall biosynthesis
MRKQLFSVSEDEIILLCVGRLLERKGFQEAILAIEKLLTDNFQVKLFIAGEGSYRHFLSGLIASKGLEDKVVLMGNRDDVDVLFDNADIFIFPSWYEGHSGTLIEAMVSGIPTVVSDIPENL